MLLFLFLFWIILNGKITLELIAFGLGCALLVYLFAWKVMGYTLRTEFTVVRNIPWFLQYVGNLFVEVVKAALTVMKLTLSSNKKPDPILVEFHSGLEGDLKNVLLANSITLTPGTITVIQEGDFFVVHCLRREYAQGLEDTSFARLLRKVRM